MVRYENQLNILKQFYSRNRKFRNTENFVVALYNGSSTSLVSRHIVQKVFVIVIQISDAIIK